MNKYPAIFYQITVIFVGLIFSGCDYSFDPLQENDELTFSMNGVLDVHADTQWIRVMPIGESLIPEDPNPNGTVVHLTHLSTGELFAMDDSLFRFGNDTYVWNYRTLTAIVADDAYEITAESPAGDRSRVVVNTPSPLPIPEVEYSETSESISVSGIALDSIIVAETRYLVQTLTEVGCAPEREVTISHLDELYLTTGNGFSLHSDNRVDIARELGVFADRFVVNYREFVLITAGPDWPENICLSDIEKSLHEVRAIVEAGTGLVAGIAWRNVEISERTPPCGE